MLIIINNNENYYLLSLRIVELAVAVEVERIFKSETNAPSTGKIP